MRATIRTLATAAIFACFAVATPARAQDYANRPVRIVVGFIPGSAADITARVLGNGLGRLLGQQFVVENKPGAGSNLAGEFSAHAPKEAIRCFSARRPTSPI